MSDFSYENNPKRCAFDALQKPSDFGYWGSEDMFKTWGFCGIQKHSMSTILEKANYEAISNYLKSRYPNDFRTESFTHWAVGNLEQLVVRVVDLPNDYDSHLLEEHLQDEGIITDAFMEVLKCHDVLRYEPVFDDNLYYSMCLDSAIELVEDWVENNPSLVKIPDNVTNWAEKIVHKLEEDGVYINVEAEDFPSDYDMMQVFYDFSLWNAEGKDRWFEWCDKANLPRPPFDLESISYWNPNQLSLFKD